MPDFPVCDGVGSSVSLDVGEYHPEVATRLLLLLAVQSEVWVLAYFSPKP